MSVQGLRRTGRGLTDVGVFTAIAAVAGAVVGVLTYRNQRRQSEHQKREAERERIIEEMKVFQDIAKGNRWEWSPWDVTVGSYDYHEWDLWRARCISYYPRFHDPVMLPIYTEFVNLLRKQQGDRDRWGIVYGQVRGEADSRLVNPRARLEELDRLLSEK